MMLAFLKDVCLAAHNAIIAHSHGHRN